MAARREGTAQTVLADERLMRWMDAKLQATDGRRIADLGPRSDYEGAVTDESRTGTRLRVAPANPDRAPATNRRLRSAADFQPLSSAADHLFPRLSQAAVGVARLPLVCWTRLPGLRAHTRQSSSRANASGPTARR